MYHVKRFMLSMSSSSLARAHLFPVLLVATESYRLVLGVESRVLSGRQSDTRREQLSEERYKRDAGPREFSQVFRHGKNASGLWNYVRYYVSTVLQGVLYTYLPIFYDFYIQKQ